ncbi:S-adenosyl-L-methionine-dependent methyltransferase [Camillea tinctor]|nr:S-adenosyl-L-methionine-dependent methyltransferase [Camillea tinctor]
MAESRSLDELSSIVQRSLSTINGALKEKGLPQPSFAHGGPTTFTLPDGLDQARTEALEAIDEIQALLRGPIDYLFYRGILAALEIGTWDLLTQFSVPQHLGADETLSYAELAQRAGLPEDDTRRIVRGALSLRVFEAVLPPSGDGGEEKVRHNALSWTLATVPEAASFLRLVSHATDAARHAAEVLRKWPEGPTAPSGADASQCGFALAHGGRGLFDWARDHPDAETDFKSAMTMQSLAPGFAVSVAAEAAALDADGKQVPETIVDVGGSAGTLAKAFLRRYPGIRSAVVQDLPGVVATSRQAGVEPEFAGRLRFAPYDFFQDQPVHGADAYLFRTILHDWSDVQAAEILRRQVPALKPGARLLINDFVVPSVGAHTHVRDQSPRAYDLLMRVVCNGKERSLDDWKRLFAAADPRYEIVGVRMPPQAKLSIIEVVWRG